MNQRYLIGDRVRIRKGAILLAGHRCGDVGKVTRVVEAGFGYAVEVNGRTGFYWVGELEPEVKR